MPFRHKKVLMVDDDADDQLLFANAMQEIDATMHYEIANNGIEALEKLKTFVPDVIFLDLNMPMMNGMECLAALKKNKMLAQIPLSSFLQPPMIKYLLPLQKKWALLHFFISR